MCNASIWIASPKKLVVTHFYEDFLTDSVMDSHAGKSDIIFARDKEEFSFI